jgi:hypothetical protein
MRITRTEHSLIALLALSVVAGLLLAVAVVNLI